MEAQTAEKATPREALQHLEGFVESLPEDRLHMRAFSEKADCGTAYCLAGFMAIDPWYREKTDILKVFGTYKSEGHLMITVKHYKITDALSAILGITVKNASVLFGMNGNCVYIPVHAVKKAEVLERVRELINGKEFIEEYPGIIASLEAAAQANQDTYDCENDAPDVIYGEYDDIEDF